MQKLPDNAHDFYRCPEVIKRMLEYCGVPIWVTKDIVIDYPPNWGALEKSPNIGELGKLMSAQYLVEYGVNVPSIAQFRSREQWQLGEILDREADVFRSLHDKNNIICVLDVERVCHHNPGDNYLDMVNMFWCLEPFHQAMMSVYRDLGLEPLVIATGQGYHYSFRIPKDTKAYKLLQEIGFVTESEKQRNIYKREGSRRKRIVTDDEALAYDGWSKIAEFIANEAMSRAADFGNQLAVVIGDQYPSPFYGKVEYGDYISVDLSASGGTLFMRDVRVPFSLHQKHKTSPWKVGHDISRNTPVNITIPRYTPCNGHELTIDDLCGNRRNFHNSYNLARAITTDIPDTSEEMEKVIDKYTHSKIGPAHDYFDQGMYHLTFEFKDSFSDLPDDIKDILWHPYNNLNQLLNPNKIRDVTLTLLHKNWHPIDIVGLLAGKCDYFGLDVNWSKYCPIKWMTAWVRAFYTQTVTGTIDWRRTVNW